ncbi:hypothetical protein RintRC_5246 [Richelia intracellularis]|nr:hypothetical protein RintRC_5246 [Richelia intracellularis]
MDPLIKPQTDLSIAISSVVKYSKDEITYWALRHCGEKHDFHLRDSFVMQLRGRRREFYLTPQSIN